MVIDNISVYVSTVSNHLDGLRITLTDYWRELFLLYVLLLSEPESSVGGPKGSISFADHYWYIATMLFFSVMAIGLLNTSETPYQAWFLRVTKAQDDKSLSYLDMTVILILIQEIYYIGAWTLGKTDDWPPKRLGTIFLEPVFSLYSFFQNQVHVFLRDTRVYRNLRFAVLALYIGFGAYAKHLELLHSTIATKKGVGHGKFTSDEAEAVHKVMSEARSSRSGRRTRQGGRE